MQIIVPPNTETIEITIVEEENPQSCWNFLPRYFLPFLRRNSDIILLTVLAIGFVVCVGLIYYLLFDNENKSEVEFTTTVIESVTN